MQQIPGEKIYEDWDCPKVEAIESYKPTQNDEIGLKKGDTANVLKKTSDGQNAFKTKKSNNHSNDLGTDDSDNNLEDECSRLQINLSLTNSNRSDPLQGSPLLVH